MGSVWPDLLMMIQGGCKGSVFLDSFKPGWGFGDEGLAEAEHLLIRLPLG